MKKIICGDDFDRATLGLAGAKAIISALGILASDAADANDGSIPISGELLAEAMNGVQMLIDDATERLCASLEPVTE